MAQISDAAAAWAQWPQEWPNMTDMKVWADTIWAQRPTHTFIPLGDDDILWIEKRLPDMQTIDRQPACLFMRSTTPPSENRFIRYHATNFRVAEQIANARVPFKGKILCGFNASKGRHKKAMHGVYISDTAEGALAYIHGSKSLEGLAALLIVEGNAEGTPIARAGSNRVWTTDMLNHDLLGMIVFKSLNGPQTEGIKPSNQHSSFVSIHCDDNYRDYCRQAFNLNREGYMLEPPFAITDVFARGTTHQQEAREEEHDSGVVNMPWNDQQDDILQKYLRSNEAAILQPWQDERGEEDPVLPDPHKQVLNLLQKQPCCRKRSRTSSQKMILCWILSGEADPQCFNNRQ